jgi:hypothetical protein
MTTNARIDSPMRTLYGVCTLHYGVGLPEIMIGMAKGVAYTIDPKYAEDVRSYLGTLQDFYPRCFFDVVFDRLS